LALPTGRFSFPAIPGANAVIFGPSGGVAGLQVVLTSTARLQFVFRDAAGTTIALVSTPVLSINTTYDVLLSINTDQATSAAGINCFINGSVQTLVVSTWAGGSGIVVGWNRDPSGFALSFNFGSIGFDLGAFWLNTTERVDITSSTERAKFAAPAIGTRGAGVTGTIPSIFYVGNADQWNDVGGLQRGSHTPARIAPGAGSLTGVSGSAWR
jgi:hypothetical protein